MVSSVVTWSKRFRVTRRLGRIHGGDTTVTGEGKKGRVKEKERNGKKGQEEF